MESQFCLLFKCYAISEFSGHIVMSLFSFQCDTHGIFGGPFLPHSVTGHDKFQNANIVVNDRILIDAAIAHCLNGTREIVDVKIGVSSKGNIEIGSHGACTKRHQRDGRDGAHVRLEYRSRGLGCALFEDLSEVPVRLLAELWEGNPVLAGMVGAEIEYAI